MTDDRPHRLPLVRSTERLQEGRPELVVYCPRTRQLLAIDECTMCELGDGLHFDTLDRGSYVRCRYQERAVRTDPIASAPGAAPVAKIMTAPVISVGPKLPLVELIDLLLARHISGVPVVDEEQRPIGVISKTDVLRWQRRRAFRDEDRTPDAAQDRELTLLASEVAADVTVDQAMMPFAFSIPADASVARAATLMAYEGVHRLPVVSADGRVIGLVSALDILEWFGRSERNIDEE